MEKQNYTVTISSKTFIYLLTWALIIGFAYLVREVLALLFAALIVTAAFDPLLKWFKNRGVPKPAALLLLYVLIVSVFSLAISFILPPLTKELAQIMFNLPYYYQQLTSGLLSWLPDYESVINQGLANLNNTLLSSVPQVLGTAANFFKTMLSVGLVLIMTFYLTVEEEGVRAFFKNIIPINYLPYITHLFVRIQSKLGYWLRGQLILSAVIFLMSLTILTAWRVPYAVSLAFLAAIFEIVPVLGPIMAAIPAAMFALIISPIAAAGVLVCYVIMQQIENHLIIPKVMGKSTGLNPLVVIVVILIGARLAGLAGILLAVPVATAIMIFLSDLFTQKSSNELRLEADEHGDNH
jgi:predicted PurR-regulated permease PerM